MTAQNQTQATPAPPPPTGARQVTLPPVHESWLPREHAMYRPRHGHRQWLALICAAVFFATPLVSLVFKPTPDRFENRKLTEFPTPDKGWGFFTTLTPWGTDHLPFRQDAIHLADWLSRNLFGEPPVLGGAKSDSPLAQAEKQPAVPSFFPIVIEGKNGWSYLGAEAETHCRPAVSLDVTMSRLRQLRDGVVASGRKFVVVVAPDKMTMAPGSLPDDYVGKACHEKVSAEFWRLMEREDFVVDLRPSLREWAAKIGEPVYGPQDAHWSDEGGVAMAQELAEKLRPGISDKWKIEPGATWQVQADIPPLIGHTGKTDGRFYSIKPDGVRDLTRQMPTEYRSPMRLQTASGPGTYGFGVGLLSDSFTIRALRYLVAAFGDMTVLHHNSVPQGDGVAAGQMLASKSVVVLEAAERNLVSGRLEILTPGLSGKIVSELNARPIR